MDIGSNASVVYSSEQTKSFLSTGLWIFMIFFSVQLFIRLTDSSLMNPLFADRLGRFPRTEEAVSKQRPRQSGTWLQLLCPVV